MLCLQTIDLTTWVCRFLSEIDQNTPFLTSFGQKTEDKLQYLCKNWEQIKVIIAKKSYFLHHFEIAQKMAFFSTIIMAPQKSLKQPSGQNKLAADFFSS